MKKKNNTKILKFPSNSGQLEKKVEAILFAAEEPLDKKSIQERLKKYSPVLPDVNGGYQKMYIDHVMQADTGADLDFLVGRRGSKVKRHSH